MTRTLVLLAPLLVACNDATRVTPASSGAPAIASVVVAPPTATVSVAASTATQAVPPSDAAITITERIVKRGFVCPSPGGACPACTPLGEAVARETRYGKLHGHGVPGLRRVSDAQREALAPLGRPCGPGEGCRGCQPPTVGEVDAILRALTPSPLYAE